MDLVCGLYVFLTDLFFSLFDLFSELSLCFGNAQYLVSSHLFEQLLYELDLYYILDLYNLVLLTVA